MKNWIGVRFLGRNSKTFYHDGAFYKAIKSTAFNFVKQKSFNFFLDALACEGFIPKTVLANIHIDGYEKMYRQHTERFSLKLSEYSWQALAQTLAYYTEKHLLTEFIPNCLGMTRKPSALPQDYNLDNFVRRLQKYFESVQVFDYNLSKKSSPRIPVLCMNKIH